MVYWRRRAVALGGVVVALVLLSWLVVATTGGDQPAPRPAAATAGSTSPTSTTGIQAPSTTPTTTTSATSTTSTSTTGTSSTTTATTATSTQPPGPPKPCQDTALELTAEVANAEYRVGQKPDFTLILTNTGDVPCVRDLNRSLMELLVHGDGGSARLWGSNDCYPNPSDDERVLQPAERAEFPVIWSGLSSRPRCAGQRVAVPAGDYQLIARFGKLSSKPAPFKLVR